MEFKNVYDKVMKELKLYFKVKENKKKLLKELTNMDWIDVGSNNVNEEINSLFDETDEILQKKLKKYKNYVKKLEKKIQLNQKSKNEFLSQNEHNCPICLEDDISEYAITRCGHIFCINCIKKSISLKIRCPMCRTILLLKDIKFLSKKTDYRVLANFKNNSILQDYVINNETNTNYIYVQKHGGILFKNIQNESALIQIKNVKNNEQYDFEEYLNYKDFLSTVKNIENNIKTMYDNKLVKMTKLLFAVMRSGIIDIGQNNRPAFDGDVIPGEF